jgi:glycosyltransferase involved in cell wall biosynthesis
VREVPAVTIGIPTKNRSSLLERAVQSVFSQDYSNLQIVISDNGSVDDTPEVCARIARGDQRVTYFRQATALRPERNFVFVQSVAKYPLFMWLADDDWLGPGYLVRCAETLSSDRRVTLVAGAVDYYEGTKVVRSGEVINLLESDPAARVRTYFQTVRDNGVFYGLTRLDSLRRTRFLDCYGWDWLAVGGLAALGHVRTLADVHLSRAVGGTSADLEALARSYPGHPMWARHGWLSLATRALGDIAIASPAYASLGPARRAWLAWQVYRCLCRRFNVSALAAAQGELRIRTRIKNAWSSVDVQWRRHRR